VSGAFDVKIDASNFDLACDEMGKLSSGLLAYALRTHTHEIGIRLSLGAQPAAA